MIHKNALYKSINFKKYIYLGDPVNAIRIFNDFEVDEVILVDIDASVNSKGVNFDLLKRIAAESRMPLCYGGGIKNIHDAEKIINLGVEKISISSEAILNPNIINSISENFGRQSTVCCLDLKKNKKNLYEAFIFNGTKKVQDKIEDLFNSFLDNGAGEILINNIDRDGTSLGFDQELINFVSKEINIPLSVLGGASNLNDISKIAKKFGILGIVGGRIFTLVGNNKSVLLNYPNPEKKKKLFSSFQNNLRY
tara:strand:- start:3945 stop:4700 length:756 start_codon:yes stop_codon:yes gene_type:complete